MRSMLTIFRYELQMLLRSRQYLALLGLVAWVCFVFYMNGVTQQEFDLARTFLDPEMLPAYLISTVFIGLYPIGRVRTTGMHSILMVRPFPTPSLMAGQWLACLVALTIPLNLLLFVDGLLLRHRYLLDFPIPPALHAELFYCLPMIGCVLALTIWVRTCFKNNLASILILAGLLALLLWLANSRLLNIADQGSRMHRFVPMISYFSSAFFETSTRRMFDQGIAVFNQPRDWLNLGASLLCAAALLMMGSYHLRRTEPQRKVLGAYGRHWHDMPTFVRMFCDLKIDPHCGWRQHLALAALVALIVARGGWSFAERMLFPGLGATSAAAMGSAPPTTPQDLKQYDPARFPEEKILPVTIHDERQTLTPDRMQIELTVTADGETSGRLAILAGRYSRYNYRLNRIALDDAALNYRENQGYLFIDGGAFGERAAGERRRLTIEGDADKSMVGAQSEGLYPMSLRSFFFIAHKKTAQNQFGDPISVFDGRVMDIWPATLDLKQAAGRDQAAGRPGSPREGADGDFKELHFEIPAQLNGPSQRLLLDTTGRYRIVARQGLRPDVRLVVSDAMEGTADDVLELIDPVLTEFRKLHRLKADRPVWLVVISLRYDRTGWEFNQIHRMRQRLKINGRLQSWENGNLFQFLTSLQGAILQNAYAADFESGGRQSFISDLYDLDPFIKRNLLCGLNRDISLARSFVPLPFQCNKASMDVSTTLKAAGRPRGQLLASRQIPVFQMLYLVLGHEKWQAMIDALKSRLADGLFDPAMLQAAAEQAAGEPMGWFFDYWLSDGQGFPAYKVARAEAIILTSDRDESTRYAVETEIANIGTGRMPTPVRLLTAKGPIEERLWIGPGETVVWRTTSPALPQHIQVDPDGWIKTAMLTNPETRAIENLPSMPVAVKLTGI